MLSQRQDLELPSGPEADAGDGGDRSRSPALSCGTGDSCSARGGPRRMQRPPSPGGELCAPGARRGVRACAAPSRSCLTVSMATQRVRGMSRGKKMKLKSLLLRYYPPGTGRVPSASSGNLDSGTGRVWGGRGCEDLREQRGPQGVSPMGPEAGRFPTWAPYSFSCWTLFLKTFKMTLLGSL